MAVDLEDEILQDFLVEAGEILELLNEQLVMLEQSPDDIELLNAIFRGFHTIKGGAGFLAFNALVTVCHKAEDVFDVLREGKRKVSVDLMDVILDVVDVVNLMFDQVKSGMDPEDAEDNLMMRLQGYTRAGDTVAVDAPVIADVVGQEVESMLGDSFADDKTQVNDEITESEFDQLLDELHGQGQFSAKKLQQQDEPEGVKAISGSDEITESEFDQLLDELHGQGQFSAKKLQQQDEPEGVKAISGSDEISENEFDNLLDELHGKGQFSGAVANTVNKKIAKVFKPAESVKKKEARAISAAEKKTGKEKTESILRGKESGKSTLSPQTEKTVRVDTHVLDEIMNMVGELVLVRNRFQTLKAAADNASESFNFNEEVAKAISNLDVITADLQLAVMKTRMQPIKKVFGRFPRIVRDLSRSLKKQIKLELVGEETGLDKNLVEALADPLVHLIRNAVDHGIELPEDRLAAGKPVEGKVVLAASQEGDHILLSIKDDGKGMDADHLRSIVVEKGLMDEETAVRLEDKECYNLIFMPGFSTKTEVSDVSGRGVGMDVVKTRITQMNGVVDIDSVKGVGSTIIIKVPLTLAIMPTLMVVLGGQTFALPLASVLEILVLDLRRTNVVDSQLVIMVRNKALPVFFLSEWLVSDPNYIVNKQSQRHVVVVDFGGKPIGFVVDKLIGQEEVVIKPLGGILQGLGGLAGATITGDGKIALILDVPGLMSRYAS